MSYIRFSKYTKIGQQSFHSRVWYRVSGKEAKEMHKLYPASSAILLKGKPVEPSPVGDSVPADLAAVVGPPKELVEANAKVMAKLGEGVAEPKEPKEAKEAAKDEAEAIEAAIAVADAEEAEAIEAAIAAAEAEEAEEVAEVAEEAEIAEEIEEVAESAEEIEEAIEQEIEEVSGEEAEEEIQE